jgi:FixJ family two-component response regulator
VPLYSARSKSSALLWRAELQVAQDFMLTAPKVIAIIDDDPSMLDAMGNLLSLMGYQTERYASAEEFVDTAMKSKAAGLIVDMQLGGMSGLELGYQLSAMGLTLPIIFVTGSEDKKLHADALEFGCVAYLRKPVRTDVLAKAIADAVG